MTRHGPCYVEDGRVVHQGGCGDCPPPASATAGVLFVPDARVEDMRRALADTSSAFGPPLPEVRPLSSLLTRTLEDPNPLGAALQPPRPTFRPETPTQYPDPLAWASTRYGPPNRHLTRHAADLWATPLRDLREALTDLARATAHVLYDATLGRRHHP